MKRTLVLSPMTQNIVTKSNNRIDCSSQAIKTLGIWVQQQSKHTQTSQVSQFKKIAMVKAVKLQVKPLRSGFNQIVNQMSS